MAVVIALAGCGGDDRGATPTATVTPRPPGVGAGARPDPQLVAGKRLVEQLGCLACHQLGTRGNSGPGDNLSAIGTRRTASQIRRSLLSGATPPMPSFRDLPGAQLAALVAYLSNLGDGNCPDTSDCG